MARQGARAIPSTGKQPSGDGVDDQWRAAKALAAMPLALPRLESDAIAPAVVFLASDASAVIPGTSLAVTGSDSADVTARRERECI